jgi:hypothetical protein
MPSKPKSIPKPNKTKRLKAIARERVGAPKPAFAIPEKAKRAKPKHKKPITPNHEDL